jgi:hypothetical protein
MKKLNYLLSGIVLMVVLVTVGCGDDEPKLSAEEQLFDKITGTWTAGTVTFGTGDDRTTDYAGFTIAFNGSKDAGYSFSTSLPAAVSSDRGPFNIESSGSWTFTNEISDASPSSVGITRTNDQLSMTLFIDSDSSARLEFNFIDEDGDGIHGNGRDEAISGNWVFTLTK